jgi:hypothetical protein
LPAISAGTHCTLRHAAALMQIKRLGDVLGGSLTGAATELRREPHQAPNSAAPQYDPQHRPAGRVLDAGQQLGLGGPAAAAVMAHAVQAAGVRNLRAIVGVLLRWDGPSACYPVRTSRDSAVAEEITSLQLRHRCSHPVALVGPPGELA